MAIILQTNNGSYSCGRSHPTHHSTPPPNSTIFLTHWGEKRSSFLCLTNLLPSDPKNLNLDWSLKWTIFHCSFVHRICSVAKSRRTFWFSLKSKVCDMESKPLIFPYLNLWERVFQEIDFPVCSQNAREIYVAISKRSFKDILKIIRSSRLVVIEGLPVLGFGSSVLSALNLLITQ